MGGVGNLLSDGASAAMGVVTGAVGRGALGGAARAAGAAVGLGGQLAGTATGGRSAGGGGFTPAQPRGLIAPAEGEGPCPRSVSGHPTPPAAATSGSSTSRAPARARRPSGRRWCDRASGRAGPSSLAFALCLLQLLVMLRLARREPDIVLISPDGKSTYLPRNSGQRGAPALSGRAAAAPQRHHRRPLHPGVSPALPGHQLDELRGVVPGSAGHAHPRAPGTAGPGGRSEQAARAGPGQRHPGGAGVRAAGHRRAERAGPPAPRRCCSAGRRPSRTAHRWPWSGCTSSSSNRLCPGRRLTRMGFSSGICRAAPRSWTPTLRPRRWSPRLVPRSATAAALIAALLLGEGAARAPGLQTS